MPYEVQKGRWRSGLPLGSEVGGWSLGNVKDIGWMLHVDGYNIFNDRATMVLPEPRPSM